MVDLMTGWKDRWIDSLADGWMNEWMEDWKDDSVVDREWWIDRQMDK